MQSLELFQGLNDSQIRQLCDCFGAHIADYNEGEIIVGEGEKLKRFAVVLKGQACSFKTDISGKVFTVSVIKEGGYIGAFLVGDKNKYSPVTVTARDNLTVLFVPFNSLVRQCEKSCLAHSMVLSNFITGISAKAMLLFERIDCLIKPTIREKVMAYLIQCRDCGDGGRAQPEITIPFNREQLAEYLNVERSALSRELSKMKRDALIDYNKNIFTIL